MKKTISILILITLCSCKITAQGDKVDNLINNFSWDSFSIKQNYGLHLSLSPQGIQVYEYGEKASEDLLNALTEPEKTVTAHLILTKLYLPKAYFLINPLCTFQGSDNIQLSMYIVNNLIWSQDDNTSDWLLNDNDKNLIIEYWTDFFDKYDNRLK